MTFFILWLYLLQTKYEALLAYIKNLRKFTAAVKITTLISAVPLLEYNELGLNPLIVIKM